MINITLPDGGVRQFKDPVSGFQLAEDISKSLAKIAVGVKVNGELKDLTHHINDDCTIEIITRNQDEALELIRHDCAHVLAQAVQELYPDTSITFGPAIENGFYYDFYREQPFSSEDFVIIEKRMGEIVDRALPFERLVWERDEAIEYFNKIGEKFKAEHIKTLPENEEISIYRQGNWLDLCRGPHLPSTKDVGKAFKLMSIAGAYWKGDSNAEQLQRIYGTCWRNQKELDAWLHQLEQARLRDHRKLGQELDLFHFQEEAKGSVFWHPKGWMIYRLVAQYMRSQLDRDLYQEVNTPQMVDRDLWLSSGHWEKFRENMFTAEVYEESQDNKRTMALKPMNCPCHVQIFNHSIRSYRDLPLRMAEFGSCHRYEPSGALHGLMRVRAFTQDDAHIFCTEDQIISESKFFCEGLKKIYKDFGFEDIFVKFSTRPEQRAGSDEVWEKAEKALLEATEAAGLQYSLNPGEGAFYGPKLEFVLRDAIGRDWQCGTLQVDFILPERLDANYIDANGTKQRPVMLHRAILGSFERFIGILIEHYVGRLPLWLAPVQVVVANISESSADWAQTVFATLQDKGIRCQIDVRSEKINYKIREHTVGKVPIIAIVGDKEKHDKSVTLREVAKEQYTTPLDKAIKQLMNESKMPE